MSGSGDGALVRLKACLATAVGVAGGLVYGPLLVQAAIVAVLVIVVVVFGLAHAHDMTVGRAAALYGGRAILALAKAAAIVMVQWPLRAGHRTGARFDVALRVQLAAVRAGYRLHDRAPAAAGPARDALRPLAVGHRPTTTTLGTAGEAVGAVEAEDRAAAAVRRVA